MKISATVLSVLLLSASVQAAVSVFAAASTTDAMKELAAAYKSDGGDTVRFNFASSGALARQIEAGAPADLFISANVRWMDWLADKEAIQTASRFKLAANTLVLVASNRNKEYRLLNKEPQNTEGTEALLHLKFLDRNFSVPPGRIAVGDFKSVPAGMYAKEALDYMGWSKAWKTKLVMASNVRTALLYVQRGEVEAGIVYATDAKAAGLPIIGTFPKESHSPIIYPAVVVSESERANRFLQFLKSDEAKAILNKHGFENL